MDDCRKHDDARMRKREQQSEGTPLQKGTGHLPEGVAADGPHIMTPSTRPWMLCATSVLNTVPGLVLTVVARFCAAVWAS